jgi:hypothetical protein
MVMSKNPPDLICQDQNSHLNIDKKDMTVCYNVQIKQRMNAILIWHKKTTDLYSEEPKL